MARNNLDEIVRKNKEQRGLIKSFIETTKSNINEIESRFDNIITLLEKGVFLPDEYMQEFQEGIWTAGRFFNPENWKGIGDMLSSAGYKNLAKEFYKASEEYKS